jgi:hypothetical protein
MSPCSLNKGKNLLPLVLKTQNIFIMLSYNFFSNFRVQKYILNYSRTNHVRLFMLPCFVKPERYKLITTFLGLLAKMAYSIIGFPDRIFCLEHVFYPSFQDWSMPL